MTISDELIDERIRSSVPRQDDSDWRDVRRRAARKRLPAALGFAALFLVLVAGPAFALRGQVADLWASAEPDKNLYVGAFADCGEGSFTVEFHPIRGAVVRQGDETLASASLADRDIECDAPIHTLNGTPDEGRSPTGSLLAVSYEASTVTCETSVPLRVSVNPIWDESGEIVGSAMSVRDRATRQAVASVVLKPPDPTASPGTSRVYWSAICSRG